MHEVASPDKLNTSVALIRQTLFEKTPSEKELAEPAGSWVDVRDVATMHVAALKLEKAHGERFIASAGPFTWQEARTCRLAGLVFALTDDQVL